MKSLHLDIPFYSSWPTDTHPEGENCTEMSLKMLLAYFLPDHKYTNEQLDVITGKKPGLAAWEMALSIWLTSNGMELIRYSIFDYRAFQKEGISYIRRAYGDDVADWQEKNGDNDVVMSQIDEYLSKITLVPKKPTIKDIVKEMNNGYVIRAMVDSGYLNGTGKYVGHSVVVTGFDDNNIWFHDPGLPALENRKVSHKLFQEAMDSFGGEMDAIKKLPDHG